MLGEVKDHENKNIRWAWRAERYADHLIKADLKTRKIDGKDCQSMSPSIWSKTIWISALESTKH